MTPHTAGASQFRASRNLTRFVENLQRFRLGQPLEGVIDIPAEHQRLRKAAEATSFELGKVDQKLSNPSFREKAPAEIVQKEEAKADELRALLDKLQTQISELGS